MIAKIITGSDINGVLAYNVQKVDSEKAKILAAPNCVTKNLREDDFSNMRISDFYKSFQSRLEKNVRTEKPVVHIVLSLKENDKDDKTLSDIACKYMEKMGYGNQPFIVVKHEDVENVHLHIISVKVDANGKKIDDRYEKRRSNQARIELEKEFNLIKAQKEGTSKAERYRKSVDLVNDYVDKITFKPDSVAYGEIDIKKRIGTVLRYVQEFHNVDGMRAYNRILAQFNVMCCEVEGVNAKGEPYKGVEYCVINSKGARISRGIRGSEFGKRYSYKGLMERFGEETSTMREDKAVKDAKKAVRYVLTNILKQYPSGISEETLSRELQRHGMSVKFFRNEEGRLFGVSFNDNVRKVTVKGSDIKFSINVIEKFLVRENESVSSKEERLIRRHIRQIYNEVRKRDYYYESDLINALPGLRQSWLNELAGRVGEMPHTAAVLDRFIRERYGQLSEVVAKERAYFAMQAKFAIDRASRMDEKLRADYLYGFGIEVGGNRLYSAKNKKVFVESDLRVGEKSAKARAFSRQERDLLKIITEDRLEEIRFDVSNYLSVFKYLNSEELLKVKRKMASDAVDRILGERNHCDAKSKIEALLERGYVIHAVKRDSKVEYYVGDVMEKEETFVRLSSELSKELDACGYEELYGNIRSTVMGRKGNFTAKYRLIVEIMRSMESGNSVRLEKRVNQLQKRNAELALRLSSLLRKNDWDGMLDLVKNYPSNSLSSSYKFKI